MKINKQKTMKKIQVLFLVIILFLQEINCQNQNDTIDISKQIENYVLTEIENHNIPGLSLAVIQNSKVLFEGYYGKSNLEFKIPVDSNHLFRIYSATKLIIATAVFQLIDEKKLTLEDSIQKYISDIPEEWSNVKIKNLLTHSSGIPNFIAYDSSLSNEQMFKKLIALPLDFKTGETFSYNQTNYWFLAKIIENISGTSLKDFIINKQFNGNSKGITFSSNSLEVIENRVSKHVFDFETDNFIKSSDQEKNRGFAGNGLNITLQRLIEWSKRLDNNQLISETSKQLMWTPFKFLKRGHFLHGWGDYSTPNFKSYGFTGGGVSAIRKFVDQNITIILLSNGYKYAPVHNDIVDIIAGIVNPKIKNQQTILYKEIANAYLTNSLEEGKSQVQSILKKNQKSQIEPILNRVGYFLLQIDINKAISAFELNTKLFPNSENTYDSLGESYFINKDFKNAKLNYQKVLQINPENSNAKNMINKIEGILSK